MPWGTSVPILIFLRFSAFEVGYEPVRDGLTDRRTYRWQKDGQDVLCGLRMAAYSWARSRGAQLTAGYTVNTYSKPPLYYTLGAVAPLLAVLRTAYTHSGLAALCADRLTRDGHDLPTSQPDNQQPFCQYPAGSWEIKISFHLSVIRRWTV